MERRAKVELFEQIRREYDFGEGTVLGVARKLGVHRRMVRQALANAQPPERKRTERERPVIAPLVPFIDANPGSRPQSAAQAASHRTSYLAADLDGDAGAESGGGDDSSSTCASASKSWGGRPARPVCHRATSPDRKARSIGMRRGRSWPASRQCCRYSRCAAWRAARAFHRAYYRATQQAFLEAHEHAFSILSGRLSHLAL